MVCILAFFGYHRKRYSVIRNYMKCTCIECKNDIDISRYPDVAVGHVIECETCGITLEVMDMNGDEMKLEIVDEGK